MSVQSKNVFLRHFINAFAVCVVVLGLVAPAHARIQLKQVKQNLLVSSGTLSSVLSYEGGSGAYLQSLIPAGVGGLSDARGMAFGADGSLYVSSFASNRILKFNGFTGEFIASFAPTFGTSGLSGPTGLTMGPDGYLYVTSSINNLVFRVDPQTGNAVNLLTAGALSGPADVIYGVDNKIYVLNANTKNVIKFDSSSFIYLGVFASVSTSSSPRSMAFGPDGNLYISSYNTHVILKCNGTTGAYLGVFASGNGMTYPYGIAFGPEDHQLYVVSSGTNSVLKFDATSGAFIDTFVSAGSGGLTGARYLSFAPIPPNQAPVANAGSSQSVDENTTVSLDGSFSHDPEGDALTYQWIQTAGTTVVLNTADPVHPSFVAPEVASSGETLTFQLVVNDGTLSSAPSSVNIQVNHVNKAPVANAGGDQSVAEETLVILDGSKSFDPDNDSLNYAWSQIAGPTVLLTGANTVHPTFTAPSASSAGASLEFQLRVSDGSVWSSPSVVKVFINNVNKPPMAYAGSDFSALERTVVSLDGSMSADPDGDPLTYQWTQTEGTPVVLDLTQPARPQFLAPEVTTAGGVLGFQLMVNDGQMNSTLSSVRVYITNENRAPVGVVGTDQTTLEGAIVSLDGSMSYDPDGESLTYVWTQTSGPIVNLNLTDPAHPTFLAPLVGVLGAHLSFQLVVNDGMDNSTPVIANVSITNVNHPPIANAGADLSVQEGSLVTLDGALSSDPDGDPLTYSWTQVAGPVVTLNLSNPSMPTFQAPIVNTGGAVLTFQLKVSDGEFESDGAIVNVSVKHINQAPLASAGAAQTVASGTLVTLDGSASYDPDGDAITYSWKQTEGPVVKILNSTAMQPTFVAPSVSVTGATLKFTLTVSDGALSSSSSVYVIVQRVNHAPVADAGEDTVIQEGMSYALDGSRSYDPDGDLLTYQWVQISGPSVVLNMLDPVHPRFVAPTAGDVTTLVFELRVSDGYLESVADQVRITVQPVSYPPLCHLAVAKPSKIWPPNHKLVQVEVGGVTDPNNSPVTITYTRVTQDEPTSGLGDGDTPVDAVRKSGNVYVRAERSGNGNGRIYRVEFRAQNSYGGSCSGTANVCVPKASGDKGCTDDGGVYNSEQ